MKQLIAKVVIVAIGNFVMGYGIAYYSVTQKSMAYVLDYQGKSYQSSLDGFINALLPIGGAVGSFISSRLSNNLGFRKTFILCDFFCIVTAFITMAPSLLTICYGRFFYGFIMGINSALDSQYIFSISPRNISGFIGSLANCIMLSGLTIAFLLQWIFLKGGYDPNENYGPFGYDSWRIILFFPALPSFIRMMSFTWIYRDDTKQVQFDESIYMKLTQTQDVQNLEKLESQLNQFEITYGDLVGKRYLKRFLVCVGFSLLNQWAGINGVNFYSVTVLAQMTGGNNFIINLSNLLNGIFSITFNLCGGYLANNYGRKFALLIGNGGCAVSLTTLTLLYYLQREESYFGMQVGSIICILSFVIFYSLSLGPIFWIYLAEVLPPQGIDIVVFVNWASFALLAQMFPIIASYQVYYCFAIFSFTTIVGQFFIWKFILETKERSRTQISFDFK